MDFSPYAVGGALRPDSFSGLTPDFRSNLWSMLQAAEQDLGPDALKITSAYRSPELQASLFADAVSRYGSPQAARRWVAPAGRSQHNLGNAVDFAGPGGGLLRDANSREAVWLRENAPRFNLAVPMDWEPWQVELAGARGAGAPNVTMSTRGPSSMPTNPQQQGLLGFLGMQRQDPSAGGETAMPFYQRPTFQDFAGRAAQAFNTLRLRPDDQLAAVIQDRRQSRQEVGRANRTIEWLSQQPGSAAYVEAIRGGADPGEALMEYQAAQTEAAAPEAPTASMQNYQFLITQGVDPETARESAFGGGVNVSLGGEGASDFREKFADLDAATLSEVQQKGINAQSTLISLNQLEALLAENPTGPAAAFKVFASNYGIQLGDDVGDLQAAQAIINAMVPQQRPPGSGPMSDKDLELFKASLPRLINTPEGNAVIIRTMRAILDYDVQGANVIAQLRRDGFTNEARNSAFNALLTRGDPLAEWRRSLSAGAPSAVGSPTAVPADSAEQLNELFVGED